MFPCCLQHVILAEIKFRQFLETVFDIGNRNTDFPQTVILPRKKNLKETTKRSGKETKNVLNCCLKLSKLNAVTLKLIYDHQCTHFPCRGDIIAAYIR